MSLLSMYTHRLLLNLRAREEGQTMAEYAVVLAVITIAIIATLGALSGAIDDALNAVIGVLPG
jgi:Flp pilus assembly pilin Flp